MTQFEELAHTSESDDEQSLPSPDKAPAAHGPGDATERSAEDLDNIRDVLTRAIKVDVLPMLKHRALNTSSAAGSTHGDKRLNSEDAHVSAQDAQIAQATAMLVDVATGNAPDANGIGSNVGESIDAVELMLRKVHDESGVQLERILLDIVAQAARTLGELWVADRADFTTVTLGSSMLTQLAYRLHHRLPYSVPPMRGRIALAPVTRDQHSLGATVLSILLQRRGWRVILEPAGDLTRLCEAVASEPVDYIGLSLSTDVCAPELTQAIQRLRAASQNPEVSILVGGQYFDNGEDNPAPVFGADVVISNCYDASAAIDALVDSDVDVEREYQPHRA